MLEKLIKAGMNIARFNMCHGTIEGTAERMRRVQALRKKLKADVLVMLDTQGPDVRIGKFKDPKVDVVAGQTFKFYFGDEHKDLLGTVDGVYVPYEKMLRIVKKGSQLALNDGHVKMTITEIKDNVITAKVDAGGVLKNHKSLAAPGYDLQLPFIAPYDIIDFKMGVEVGVDMIAASEVSRPQDILDLRKWLDENGGEKIKIISKIESRIGISNLDRIVELSDGHMFARGGLGTDVGLENLAPLQKQVIRAFRDAGKMIICATEMLESMTEKPSPTRAEASDVANAVWDGATHLMLSGETTVGKYPVQCVEFMVKAAAVAEKHPQYNRFAK